MRASLGASAAARYAAGIACGRFDATRPGQLSVISGLAPGVWAKADCAEASSPERPNRPAARIDSRVKKAEAAMERSVTFSQWSLTQRAADRPVFIACTQIANSAFAPRGGCR